MIRGIRDKGYIWNPSNCKCECDKSCNINEYLDYSSCKYKRKLIDPLLEECTNDRCRSFVVYKVLFWITFVIACGTVIYIVYHVYVNCIKYNLPY